MSVLKKRKAYEVENITCVDKGKITGVSVENYICERKDTPEKTMKLPDNITKIYINNR